MAYSKDEREMHLWYNELSNKTTVESTHRRTMTKIERSGWEILKREYDDNGILCYISAQTNGLMATIRSVKQ